MKTIESALFIIILFLTTANSCKKDTDCKDELGCNDNNCVKDLEIIDINPNCLSGNMQDSYVINDDSTYNSLKNSLYSLCDTIELPYIDFSKRTLLGKYIQGGGCEICFHRKVFKNTESKVYTYKIKIIEIGTCEMLRYSMNWITIPKIPDEYNVIFQIEKKYYKN